MMRNPLLLLCTLLLTLSHVSAQEIGQFELKIENQNTGQNFSPPAILLHDETYFAYVLGEPPSQALAELAEDGATAKFKAIAESDPAISQFIVGPSVHRRRSPTAIIEFNAPVGQRLSIVTMLTVTNDGFTGVQGILLPSTPGESVSTGLPALDAGSEANTESCDHVPCNTHGVRMTEGAEGLVAPHPGITGDVDISIRRQWAGNSLGTVTITRVE